MPKRLLLVLGLFSPLAAQANCNSFDASTRTLQVRTQAPQARKVECDASGYAISEGSTPAGAAHHSTSRRSNVEKLRGFTDLKRQAEYLNNAQRYYGQR